MKTPNKKILIIPSTHFGVAFVGEVVRRTEMSGTICYILRDASVITQSGVGPDWCLIARSPKERSNMKSTRCPKGKVKVYFSFGYTVEWMGDLPNLKGE